MLTCRGAGDGELGMQRRRRADDHRVDVTTLQQLLGALVDGHLHQARCPRARRRVGVGRGDERGTAESPEHWQVDPVGDRAATEQAEPH